jgi:hypothetical protein
MQRFARAVRDNGADVEPAGAHDVGHANIYSAFRNAVAIRVLFVAGLTRSSAAWRRDLGMNVCEGERVRCNRCSFARPRRVAVDTQLEGSEEPRLAEVVTP